MTAHDKLQTESSQLALQGRSTSADCLDERCLLRWRGIHQTYLAFQVEGC
jgi:hypothetical protein